jgi:hypothetical protein
MLPSMGTEHGVSGELQAVIRVDVRAPFVGGRLGAQRHAQKYLRWSRKCPRVPRERSPSLGYVSNVPLVIPRSASEATVNPSGASIRTPDQ